MAKAWRARDKPLVRPPELAFALDDQPPRAVVAVMALQYLIVLSSYLVLPIVVATAAASSPVEEIDYVRMALVVTGLTTLLQCATRGPVGSGYPVPHLASPIFVGSSILAAHAGGLGLVSGMTLFAGVVMMGLSSAIGRMRPFLPTEVIGVIVLMVGIGLLPGSLTNVLAVPAGATGVTRAEVALIFLLSFGTMAAITMMRSGFQRFGVLAGAAVGVIASLLVGALNPQSHTIWAAASWFAFPLPHPLTSLRFEWELAAPFAVAALASTAKSVGDLTVFQRANDVSWVRPDMAPLKRGILASGVGSCAAGLLGAMGTGTAASCIGLALATRTTSRVIAAVTGGVAIALGFLPFVAALFVMIPDPVKGSLVLFVGCFLMVSGFQLITSRMLDSRRTLIVGTSLSFGLGVSMVPELYRFIPVAFQSGLTVTALLALGLNALSRLGVAMSESFDLRLGPDAGNQLAARLNLLGGKWGARRDVIVRVSGALTELAEALAMRSAERVSIEVRFDEFSIVARARFDGPPLPLPVERPSKAVLADSDDGLALLSGYMLRGFCNQVEQRAVDGQMLIEMRFDH